MFFNVYLNTFLLLVTLTSLNLHALAHEWIIAGKISYLIKYLI